MTDTQPYLHWPPGLHRTDAGIWLQEDGQPVADEEVLTRVKALAIPPAWKHVWAATDASERVQARGVDSKGRVQYRYSQIATQAAAEDKYHHMLHFAEGLPGLRQKVLHDLRRRPQAPDASQVTALAVRLLDLGLFRVGTKRYATQNHTYGLTTLEASHVSVAGHQLLFDFVGKEHVRQTHTVQDPLAVRVMRKLLEHKVSATEPLFQTPAPNYQNIGSVSVNTYIHAVNGSGASAKMFRTWGATVIAAAVMAGAEHSSTKKHRDRSLYAFDAAAKTLGNTPTMARASYVHPKAIEVGDHPPLRAALEDAANRLGTKRVHEVFTDQHLQAAVLDSIRLRENPK